MVTARLLIRWFRVQFSDGPSNKINKLRHSAFQRFTRLIDYKLTTGRRDYLTISAACVLIALVASLFISCAHAVAPNCADDSIVAAEIYHMRTGRKTFIIKSQDGTHSQAYALINGVETPLHVYPLFKWYIMESQEDDLNGGRGKTYTVDEFIRVHGFRRSK